MACTPADFQELTRAQGFVYHVTPRRALASIMEDGVQPWDHTGNAKFNGTMQARVGHTYWALASYNMLMEDLAFCL